MDFFEICKLEKGELKKTLEKELTNMGYAVTNADGFLYAEGTVPVLLLAHMDTVHKEKCSIICTDGNYVMSPQGIGGDDRCGIFMVLETIKELRCSVLFTEDEEIGCVGAKKFCDSGITPTVPINYLIEYDRKNADDAVFYSCDNPDFEKFITDENIGFKTAHGSCSDISHVAPYLKTAAVNLSCGYYNQHTLHEYVIMSEMTNNIERGKALIRKPCDHFEYIEKKYDYKSSYSNYGYGGKWGRSYDLTGYYSGKSYSYDYDLDDYDSELKTSYRQEVYADLDEYAITLFGEWYGREIPQVEMFALTDIADYDPKKYIIHSAYGAMSIAEYMDMYSGDPDFIEFAVDKKCNIYCIKTESTCCINVAITMDGDYISGIDDSIHVMYYPSDLVKYPRMTEGQFWSFESYCEIQLDEDIEELVESYTKATI